MILKSVEFKKKPINSEFPFNLPLFQSMEAISFNKKVTILVGENGSGKSTLLEAIAYHADSIRIGSYENDKWNTNISRLTEEMKLIWSARIKDGFFLTSEDFINYVRRLTAMKEEAKRNLDEIEIEYKDRSQFAKNLASMPHNNTLNDLKNLYDEGLEYRSHGERYLDFFQSRIKPKGLYILDEPEVPLSPMKQLSLISLIKGVVKEGAQFLIATHSPMLMAMPDAEIISLDILPPEVTTFKDLEHVQITKSFLDNPERYLKHL